MNHRCKLIPSLLLVLAGLAGCGVKEIPPDTSGGDSGAAMGGPGMTGTGMGGPGMGGPGMGGPGMGGPGMGMGGPMGAGGPPSGGAPPAGVAIENGVANLSPENTTIQFIGTHVGDNPDPRTGEFADFSGQLEVDSVTNTLKAVSIEIKTESLTTPMDPLTTHLKSPDFFDAREHPTATFQSTSVNAGGDDGSFEIVGNLTLLKETKEITLPASLKAAPGGILLSGKISIDRTEWGMNKLQERVEKMVELSFQVGDPGGGADAGESGPLAIGTPGAFDPTSMFDSFDANRDGKLAGNEIPEAMRARAAEMDKDGDGAITREEMRSGVQAMMQKGL